MLVLQKVNSGTRASSLFEHTKFDGCQIFTEYSLGKFLRMSKCSVIKNLMPSQLYSKCQGTWVLTTVMGNVYVTIILVILSMFTSAFTNLCLSWVENMVSIAT